MGVIYSSCFDRILRAQALARGLRVLAAGAALADLRQLPRAHHRVDRPLGLRGRVLLRRVLPAELDRCEL